MSISLTDISHGKALRAPRCVLLGVEKVGKSTWASQCPGTVFIPIVGEEGIDELDVAKFPACKSFSEVMQALELLYTGLHEYTHVCLDSASTLEPLIWDAVCAHHNAPSIERVLGGFGKGYVEALKWWRDLTVGLDALRNERNMAVTLIGHCKVKMFNDPLTDPYDTYIFDIQDRAANLLNRWADAILFATFKAFASKKALAGDKATNHAIGTGERVLYTQKRPAHPGGNRYGLPYELPLHYGAFTAELSKARSQT